MSSAGALGSELLKTRLTRFTRMLDGVEQGEIRSVHRARVASRRLRELVPILQLDGAASKRLTRRLRQVTARLGTVRELDVILALTDELHAARPTFARALHRVAVEVSKARDTARKQLAQDLPVDRMWRIARKLDRALQDLRTHEKSSLKRPVDGTKAALWAVDARVVHRAARLHAAIRMAGALYLPERLHAVRIALKKLRYAVELSAQMAGLVKKTTPILRPLKRGQDVLGRMHDLQVLIDRVRSVQASLTPPNVAMWRELNVLVVSLEDECRRLHARYVRDSVALSSIASRLAARSPASPQKRRAG